jgi:hypothetical protein
LESLQWFFFERKSVLEFYKKVWDGISIGVPKGLGNFDEYFKRWGWNAIKDDILKPKMGISEYEINRMNTDQVLIRLTKIKENDACTYHEQKAWERKNKAKSKI